MDKTNPKPFSSSLCRTAVLAAALGICGCAAPVAERPLVVEQQDEGGFVITEDISVATDVRTDYQQAIGLLEQAQYERGIALLVRVTERAPEATAAFIDLGIAYRKAGDLEKAEAALARALELNPRHPVAHNEMGMLCRRTGRFEDARMHYEQALAIYPAFHYARRNLAVLCDLYLADLQCALRNYELYTEAVPGDDEAAMWVADLRNRVAQ